jgi:hypothetical protein
MFAFFLTTACVCRFDAAHCQGSPGLCHHDIYLRVLQELLPPTKYRWSYIILALTRCRVTCIWVCHLIKNTSLGQSVIQLSMCLFKYSFSHTVKSIKNTCFVCVSFQFTRDVGLVDSDERPLVSDAQRRLYARHIPFSKPNQTLDDVMPVPTQQPTDPTYLALLTASRSRQAGTFSACSFSLVSYLARKGWLPFTSMMNSNTSPRALARSCIKCGRSFAR